MFTVYVYMREEGNLQETDLKKLEFQMGIRAGVPPKTKDLTLTPDADGVLYVRIKQNDEHNHLDALRMAEEKGYVFIESNYE